MPQIPSDEPPFVTRFAPSPTGRLHLGHAYSALLAHDAAMAANGRFLLRIDDLDSGRSRAEFVTAIYEDLAWLGLDWETPVMVQSTRAPAYHVALDRLTALGLTYPCFCTRREIAAEIEAAGGAPHGVDGPIYPGTCRGLTAAEQATLQAAGKPHVVRLDMAAACGRITDPLDWIDAQTGALVRAKPEPFGDIVLWRKDSPASYHLAVVVDDAAQAVSCVIRGEDLGPATALHRLLQTLLGLPAPRYWHHRLICDDQGRRLAKRDDARALVSLRAAGWTLENVRNAVGID